MKRSKPCTINLVKDVLFQEILKYPGGISFRSLCTKKGINPSFEEDRPKVWKFISALVSLQRDGHVVSDIQDNMRFYYPQAT